MVKAVVFDLDDTLISEKEYIKSGYCHIAMIIESRFDVDKNQIYSDLMQLFNKSSRNVFNRLFDRYSISYSKAMILDLVNEYRSHYPEIVFFDDVIPCLNELKRLGIKTGIITDGYAIAQRQKLKAIQAEKFFDEIIMTDELGRDYWKPHPKAFEVIKEKFDVNFDEMIYVGDNPEKDFYIGSICPINTVRISRGDTVYCKMEYFKNAKEHYSIDNLYELIRILSCYRKVTGGKI